MRAENVAHPDDVVIFDGVCNLCAHSVKFILALSGAWRILGVVKVIPRPVRDWASDFVARNRYRWFGRSDTCMVPTPELRARFIQE